MWARSGPEPPVSGGALGHPPDGADPLRRDHRTQGEPPPARHHPHRAILAETDRTTHDHIPTTSLPRTLLDLASLTPLDAVVRALEEAERRGLIDTRPIRELLTRANGHPGGRALQRALSVYDPQSARTKSELERRFLTLIAQAGLPRPTLNTLVAGFEVDVVWRKERLIVELDGFATHGTRAAFERDRKRDAALLAAGHRTLRVTARRLDVEPAAIVAQVGVLLTA
ncbi:MAG TPA: DUF559 domain-containing protein [Solirubrobacteraceae bacterium]|nr:DUF559 domain-containing protein [Solirubrobacteraceae bacterium]